ncbi:MAG: GNAT family N-acetyltransferase [Clostridia bacterium]|nr:GNAT family N-acetyltransferase [Clostridia bacterium]
MNNETYNDYKIRKILPKDNSALAEIIRYNLKNHGLDIPGTVYFDAELDRLSEVYSGSEKRGYFVLADSDDNVIGGIGFAEFLPIENCAELQKLYLADSVKGIGLGYKLISFVEEKMAEAGFKSSYLETHENLKAALHIYEKSGYSQIERPKDVMHGAMTHFYFKELSL